MKKKKRVQASAPAKIILAGEHAVVYLRPALLSACDTRATVTITSSPDKKIHTRIPALHLATSYTVDEILLHTKKQRSNWEKFQENRDVALLKKGKEKKDHLIQTAIGEAILAYDLPKEPFDLTLTSEIPIGANMGSSAAVAASVITALFAWHGLPFSKDRINSVTYEVEKRQHGSPSGGDNSIVVFGGTIWFRKETETLKIIQPLPFLTTLPDLYLIDTGTPSQTTGEMVAMVKESYLANPSVLEKIFTEMENHTKKLFTSLDHKDTSKIADIWKAYHRCLVALQVVPTPIQELITALENIGASAKIQGAGARYGSSAGQILVYTQDTKKLLPFLRKTKLPHSKARLGARGVTVERKIL
ncbi:MAG TPA: mevalonate kinase [Patescibacteria group bacterium]|nr:mevalonate kinase [Patescibacteria group bacterium]